MNSDHYFAHDYDDDDGSGGDDVWILMLLENNM